MLRDIDHFIGGESFTSGDRTSEVFDPNQGQVQASVRLGTTADLEKAVEAAKAAQPAWAATTPPRRARVMFKFKELVEAELGIPNHQEYRDFRLRLDKVQRGSPAAWTALTRAHYANCPTGN